MASSIIPRLWTPTRFERPVPPIIAAWPEFSIDVSNWQGNLGDEFFTTWGKGGYSGLIVQAVTGQDGRSYTEQQLQAALDHEWKVAAYVWCSQGDATSSDRINRRLELLEGFEADLHFVALDVEETELQPEDVDADLALCDEVTGDTPIYTGRWVFERLGWTDEAWWSTRRLWDSRYDNIANVDAGWHPYGGWTERWMKQFTENPLDLNICRVSS